MPAIVVVLILGPFGLFYTALAKVEFMMTMGLLALSTVLWLASAGKLWWPLTGVALVWTIVRFRICNAHVVSLRAAAEQAKATAPTTT